MHEEEEKRLTGNSIEEEKADRKKDRKKQTKRFRKKKNFASEQVVTKSQNEATLQTQM